MKRFLIIQNNKIIADRYDSREIIQDGEVEDDGTYGKQGEVLIDGVWKRDPKEIAEQIKQNRIAELKEIIDTKGRYLGDDVSDERAELRELLGL